VIFKLSAPDRQRKNPDSTLAPQFSSQSILESPSDFGGQENILKTDRVRNIQGRELKLVPLIRELSSHWHRSTGWDGFHPSLSDGADPTDSQPRRCRNRSLEVEAQTHPLPGLLPANDTERRGELRRLWITQREEHAYSERYGRIVSGGLPLRNNAARPPRGGSA
jgi:hypothetical protein